MKVIITLNEGSGDGTYGNICPMTMDVQIMDIASQPQLIRAKKTIEAALVILQEVNQA